MHNKEKDKDVNLIRKPSHEEKNSIINNDCKY